VLLSELVSRDIGILGAGREGLAAWRWIRKRLPEKPLTIYDERPESEFSDQPFDANVDRLVCGEFDVDLLSRHEVLIRSPGISPYRPEFVELQNKGVRFTSASSLWFSSHPTAKTICITGTKGKSTTAALVAQLTRVVWAGCTSGWQHWSAIAEFRWR
jgi:UDP-N-acetylmuramoylalanine--D-glutamate ligase